MEIIDGRKLAQKIKDQVKKEVESLKVSDNLIPKLAVILVGNDSGSQIYVEKKKKACEELGIISEIISFKEDITQIELSETVQELNNDPKVSGILVQLPLPKHINEEEIINLIKPKKDVDCFNPINVGKLCIGEEAYFEPCTPQGIIELIKQTNQTIEGKECVVIGRSNIVGKPTVQLLLKENATVTICHSKTKNIESIIKRADIVVIAIGRTNFLKGYMLKQGATVIDVGMNRQEDGKVKGDADFESISKVAAFVTPVPGGVGPVTVAMLMKNTLKAAKLNNNPYLDNVNE